jgi:hypothetical protein
MTSGWKVSVVGRSSRAAEASSSVHASSHADAAVGRLPRPIPNQM